MLPVNRQRHEVLIALMKQAGTDAIRHACCPVSPGHEPRAAALLRPVLERADDEQAVVAGGPEYLMTSRSPTHPRGPAP
ncbi:MAG: hypothetical protein AB7U39_10115 [Ilumatobacteraceae bacterium]